MKRLVLTVFLLIPPKFACADILHIMDSGAADYHPANTTTAGLKATDHHLVYNYSTIPGSGWDFGFAFVKSSATFQWQVDVTVEANTREAGHNHNEPPPRLFYYPYWPEKKTVARFDGMTVRSPQLDQDQIFYVHMAPVNYAARLKVIGAFTGSNQGVIFKPILTYILDIKTPGIEPVPVNDRLYRSAGGTTDHPENHYGSTAIIAALTRLADAWKNTHPGAPLIEIGNISLPWGGTFDVKGDWKADNMHHAYGIAADIGKTNFSDSERAALIKLMCGSGFYVYNRIEDNKKQYHIVDKEEYKTLKGLRWPVKLPTKTERAIDCCAAKPGAPDYQKCTGP